MASRASPEATPITDFALIESHKENIRPLAGGRSAATLSSLFEKSEAEKVLQDGHDQFRKDIEEAERRDGMGEDMLEGYTDILDVYNRQVSSST
jgi:checkpoint serine/threonine-protein kinase